MTEKEVLSSVRASSTDSVKWEISGSTNLGMVFLPRLFKQLSIPKGSRILDVGCGQGVVVKVLREQGFEAFGLEPGGRYYQADESIRDIYILIISLTTIQRTLATIALSMS